MRIKKGFIYCFLLLSLGAGAVLFLQPGHVAKHVGAGAGLKLPADAAFSASGQEKATEKQFEVPGFSVLKFVSNFLPFGQSE